MWIYDSFFEVRGFTVEETRDSLVAGRRLDSFTAYIEKSSVPDLEIPKEFAKFKSLPSDENFKAILRAAILLTKPEKGRTGVFVAVGNSHASKLGSRYAMYDMLPGIISYVLDLKGPGAFLSSTCDSFGSMVTMARAYISSGLIDHALLLTSNLMLEGSDFKPSAILSSNGRCLPFTTLRDGSWPGLGAGGVVISNSRPAGHGVVGLRSSVTFSAGRDRASFTAPSIDAQQSAIEEAWGIAERDLGRASFIECHATGTKIGDSLEIESLKRALRRDHRIDPLLISASKEFIGHLDSASGLASLTRTYDHLLGMVAPKCSPKAKENEDVELMDGKVRLAFGERLNSQEATAGVTMNGISGSTTHIVLEREVL
ncbi:iron aquisition yersiniabactin synthesis enzyme (Irp1,polyketide synthetase) @ Siderophore biosynthesis non-ribosomal peptide synthetase modules [Corynebacterium casei]|uniref:beta-ketoacyl synthase N-terminal-like domain-containing protein n=1 Tax=Corynebacterium casei TaxID=160386 RepID=UPI0009C5770C|nr:beta-ketoacyl synthase N-terminal-like domain-containing protein [Corynebacterium casei]SLM93131.1 iron aquisition yersiniabactin synthesis enzyme (Irp1,polyketide synthetase) @ Siderophore biosynthesis non-ribosomal peptide synthetase modules [Corynebacterium casei]